ncbi:segregation/condensation protein A [Candidatus Woesearchaeota archaeon]|nr:segregation/condensation protein A [Candidatus Woesearchaeota archaeon]
MPGFKTSSGDAHARIMDLLFEQDEITWQSMIYALIKQEGMDPWDIDVSVIAKRFIELLKTMKQMDFRIPAKIVLASAILLRIQSKNLLKEDIAWLDEIITGQQWEEPEDFEQEQKPLIQNQDEKPVIIPRIPRLRKRKVSVQDLIKALEKALEVEARRIARKRKIVVQPPKPSKRLEITELIKKVYASIKKLFKKHKTGITFKQLVPSMKKEEVIYTYMPLLYLDSEQKIFLEQEKPFDEIKIKPPKKEKT